MRIVIGIPSRMGSSRLPGKPMKKILDKTMIEHVYKRCSLSKYASDVFVATPDIEIQEEVEKLGGKVIITEQNISRPGLRVAVAAETLNLDDNDIVVVVQGDEPLVHPGMIDLAIEPLISESDVYVSNLTDRFQSDEEWKDPNEIKVVTDLNMNAIYMSRSPIPSVEHEEVRGPRLKQICIMPFRWHFLKKFNHELSETPLELAESIEMIRAIQHGYKVRMVQTKYLSKSVDTEEDRLDVEQIMKNDEIYKEYGF
jgi:3-deoxy-manno-octulosonate cytidylyltransferase (CMP-KDO synthetase)